MRFVVLAVPVLALVLGAPVQRARAEEPSSRPAAAVPLGPGSVNINTASVDELDRLPGVGPAKAAAIAAFRTKHGLFKRIEDLDRVKGFGRKLMGRVRPFVALSGPTTYVGKPGSRKDSTKLQRARSD